MFLVVHASAGAVLGSYIGVPAPAAALGFLSHFLLDIIPHGDETLGKQFIDAKRHGWLAVLAVLDAVAALSLVSLVTLSGVLPNPTAAFAGAVGAMIPDILSGFTIVSKDKFLPDFDRLHERNHRLLGIEAPVLIGGALQAATLILVFSLPLWLFR